MFELAFWGMGIIVLSAWGFHRYRNHLTYKPQAQVYTAPFDGEVYLVGRAAVAKRPPISDTAPTRTVVCMPGFLEDMRYFLDLYKDANVELILVNSADYHVPLTTAQVTRVTWGDSNPYRPSAIEYDAHVVACAVQHVATTDNITFHGHSRGGAVMLELGKQAPVLVQHASVILEAPALPQGRLSGGGEKIFSRIGAYFLPMIFTRNRHLSMEALHKMPMMTPTNAVKTDLLRGMFCAPKSYRVALKNIFNIIEWQRQNHQEVYENFHRISVVIGERDHVLSRRAMMASAQMSPRVNVVETQGTNHFISLEKPQAILETAELA